MALKRENKRKINHMEKSYDCASDLSLRIYESCLDQDACGEEQPIKCVKAGASLNDAKEKRLGLLNVDYIYEANISPWHTRFLLS